MGSKILNVPYKCQNDADANLKHTDCGPCCIAMILGGAVGNVIDRVTHGAVVDFISLHWHRAYTFPAFNLADSAITLGAICLIVDELRRVRKG